MDARWQDKLTGSSVSLEHSSIASSGGVLIALHYCTLLLLYFIIILLSLLYFFHDSVGMQYMGNCSMGKSVVKSRGEMLRNFAVTGEW